MLTSVRKKSFTSVYSRDQIEWTHISSMFVCKIHDNDYGNRLNASTPPNGVSFRTGPRFNGGIPSYRTNTNGNMSSPLLIPACGCGRPVACVLENLPAEVKVPGTIRCHKYPALFTR